MKSLLQTALIRGLGFALIWIIGRTTRLVRVNWHVIETLERQGQPYLLAIWHNNIICGVYSLGVNRYPAIISRSRDGEHITWVMERFGFEGLRGSDSAGASGVLRVALRTLAAGRSICVTPDGPLGPRYEVKPGILALARKRGVPIVPLCFSAPRRWEFPSWDRMKLPKPFSTVHMFVGAPLWFAPENSGKGEEAVETEETENSVESEEAARLRLQGAMRDQVRLAEAFSGADAIFHDPVLGKPGTVEDLRNEGESAENTEGG